MKESSEAGAVAGLTSGHQPFCELLSEVTCYYCHISSFLITRLLSPLMSLFYVLRAIFSRVLFSVIVGEVHPPHPHTHPPQPFTSKRDQKARRKSSLPTRVQGTSQCLHEEQVSGSPPDPTASLRHPFLSCVTGILSCMVCI